jgi:outer membrane protein assembly factor BamA
VKKIALLIPALMLCLQLRAQKMYYLNISPADRNEIQDYKYLKKALSYRNTFTDTISRNKELSSVLLRLYDNGYLAASFDSISRDSSTLHAYLRLGRTYKWIVIARGNIEESLLSEAGYREKIYTRKPVYYRQVRHLQEKILTYLENNGYPFASIRMDSIEIKDNEIHARLKLNKNTRYRIDSIIVKGNASISKAYLYNYLSIKPGDPYNESLVRQVSTRISEIPFLEESRPFDISFSDHKSALYLYLKNKRASQFDFIAGFFQDKNNSSKIIITGEAHLRLQNSFGRGEILDINWKSPLPLTQDLKARIIYPFVFNTAFGIDASFNLFKRDTTFLDIIKNLGLQYILNRGNYFKAFIIDRQSSLLNTKRYEDGLIKPEQLDVRSLSYGLGYRTEKLDYRLNPRSGFSGEFSGSIGTRKILVNPRLPAKVYEDLQLSTSIYNGDYVMDYYIPWKNRSVINLGIKGAVQVAPNILKNELFRIGGLRTLRGFDEESILASFYTISKLEYRYLLEQNSYMFAFYNIAYYENRSNNQFVKDTPYGFGAGISFETRLGIFSFTYALGKQFDNPVYLRSGKIHFGIVSYF